VASVSDSICHKQVGLSVAAGQGGGAGWQQQVAAVSGSQGDRMLVQGSGSE
jgi:hypothetical protein